MSHANQPIQYHNSDFNNYGPSDFKYADEKKLACDRCRGQKLRCIWMDGEIGQCRRCVKANVVCMTLPPRPMGRPARPTHRFNSQSRNNQAPASLKDPEWEAPTFCSDNTSDPFLDTGPTMNPNGPATPPFVPPDFNIEADDDMDEDTDDESLSLITKLSRLNLALYRNLRQMNTDQGKSPSPVMTSVPLESPSIPNPKVGMVPPGMIGRLLSLTDQFTTLLGQLGLLARVHGDHDSGTNITSSHGSVPAANRQGNPSQRDHSRGSFNAYRWKQHDPSTTLLVMSCYLQLKEMHSHCRRVLDHVMSRDGEIDSFTELLPNLVIEGFSLAGHGRLQLGMTAKLCEQMFDRIGRCLGLDDKVSDVAADCADELVKKIWGFFGRGMSP